MSALPLRQPRDRSGRVADRVRRPQLRVVPEPRRRHPALFGALYLIVAAGTVFGAVSLNALAAGDAVSARELEERVEIEERRYGQLVAEVAALEDPARIRQAAVDLGMIPAGSPRYLVLDRALPSDGVVEEPVVAGATADPLKPVLSADR